MQVRDLIDRAMTTASRYSYIACLIGLVTFVAPRPATALPQAAGPRYQVEGVVKDPSGAVITGAQVVLRTGGYEAHQSTRTDGRFDFAGVPAPDGRLMVSAKGFASAEKEWKVGRGKQLLSLEIVLSPAPLAQEVSVTATRMQTPLSQTTADVRVLTHQEVAATPALTLDGVLQQVPGFTLFRRTGSRVANPTAQGVSLRGVGASGASRALVLKDGIPLNDPFGGWVYWDRVPREAVGRLEVVRGGVSDLYGSQAMGGVINVVTRKATTSEFSLDTSYGNETTPTGSFWSSIRHGPWAADLDGEAFSTDGYILINQQDRGAVDTPANSEHEVGDATLERKLGENGKVFATATYFREIRANGTPLTYNRTHTRQPAIGAD